MEQFREDWELMGISLLCPYSIFFPLIGFCLGWSFVAAWFRLKSVQCLAWTKHSYWLISPYSEKYMAKFYINWSKALPTRREEGMLHFFIHVNEYEHWKENKKRIIKYSFYFSHYPKVKHTAVADTPENARIAQNTKIQSQVRIRLNAYIVCSAFMLK